MKAKEAKRLKELQQENARLKKLLADAHLDNDILKSAMDHLGRLWEMHSLLDPLGWPNRARWRDQPRPGQVFCPLGRIVHPNLPRPNPHL